MPPKYAPNQKLTWWLHDYQRNIAKSQIQTKGLKILFQTILLPDHAPRAAAEAGLEQKYESKNNLELTQCIVNYFSAFLHLREHEMIGTVEHFNTQLITEPQIIHVGSIYTHSLIFHTYNCLFAISVCPRSIGRVFTARLLRGSPVPRAAPGEAAPAGGVNRAVLSFCKGGTGWEHGLRWAGGTGTRDTRKK